MAGHNHGSKWKLYLYNTNAVSCVITLIKSMLGVAFAASDCMSPQGQVYKSVVNDTIAAVRSFFLDEGVDEQVLQELKTLWETKLNQSRAVDLKEPEAPAQSAKAARAAAGTETWQLAL